MAEKEPWQLTATEVLPLLRSGKLKVETYARSLLSRIQQRDQDVKAWVYLDPSLILRTAQKLDDLPAEERGPLHGLPIAIKDVMLTKDMPTQYNSTLFEDDTPIGMDANCVMSMRKAGALIFGKTTTTEFASSKKANYHQNRSTNPHDKARTPGGSSSGSGAVVADYQCPLSTGTQTGGSVVRPASFNGCYGFKPTYGAISREGLAFCSVTLDTFGLFARCVEDFEPLLDIFEVWDDEPVPKDPFEMKGAKVGFYNSEYWPNAGPGTKQAMQKAREIVKKHGAETEEVSLPAEFKHVLPWHTCIMAMEGQTSFRGQYSIDRTQLAEEILGFVENKNEYSRRYQLEAYDGCARLRPMFDEVAGQYDVIITPSVPDEAPADVSNTGDMSFCSTWTIMHVPALNIPGFAGEHGMPIGLTAVASRFRDRHLLHIAKTLGPIFEAEGGWQPKNVDASAKSKASSGYRSV